MGMTSEDLNVHIINLAIDNGYTLPGEDLIATMWDFETGTRWAAINALEYLNEYVVGDGHHLILDENQLVLIPDEEANAHN